MHDARYGSLAVVWTQSSGPSTQDSGLRTIVCPSPRRPSPAVFIICHSPFAAFIHHSSFITHHSLPPSPPRPLRRPSRNHISYQSIETRQADVIRKILEHCGPWHDPPPRAPPRPISPSRPVRSSARMEFARGSTDEVDPDFLEHLRREAMVQLELPWEA